MAFGHHAAFFLCWINKSIYKSDQVRCNGESPLTWCHTLDFTPEYFCYGLLASSAAKSCGNCNLFWKYGEVGQKLVLKFSRLSKNHTIKSSESQPRTTQPLIDWAICMSLSVSKPGMHNWCHYTCLWHDVTTADTSPMSDWEATIWLKAITCSRGKKLVLE